MTHDKKFKNESQDARRHDKHNEAHPDDKMDKNHGKSDKNSHKPADVSPAAKR